MAKPVRLATASRTPDNATVALIGAHPDPGPPALDRALAEVGDDGVAATPTLDLRPGRAMVRIPPGERDPVTWRRRGGAAARRALAVGSEHLRCDFADEVAGEDAARVLLGAIQGGYAWDRYRDASGLASIAVRGGAAAARRRRVAHLGEAMHLARDLINTPAMDMGPAQFVAAARRAAKGSGLRLRLLDERACRDAKMGALCAVGAAAAGDRRPRMLVLEGPKSARPRLALCGKGVCFDSGGLQVKSSKGMEAMRKDMGGAATVLAAMIAAARCGAADGVRAYLPLVENAISGPAFRPGDVLTAADGTTIEVGHTDAEGRLILADALCLARKEKARKVVTVATLTGAALIALGRIHVPLMADDDDLAAAIGAAFAAHGEKCWRLPLDDDHRKLVRSKVATLTNSAGPDASCITAGAFLEHFAGGLPFAHLDISPASWQEGDHVLGPAGATGVAVTPLAELIAGKALL